MDYFFAHFPDYMRFFAAALVLLNPIGAVPIFLSLMTNQTTMRRKQAALSASITVCAVLVCSLLGGEWVLRMFGINLPCFEVGGGVLIMLMAVSMLNARQGRTRHTPEEAKEAEEAASVGAVPLGTPLLAGPGSISSAIIFAKDAQNWFDTGMLVALCFLTAVCVWIVLRLAEPIGTALGRTGINIMTRLMGLVLAAIAVKFFADGVSQIMRSF